MMTSALVLIAAILLLGGLLAALGDYLGTKVGKARLRIFKLRPRQTATFVTIFTGTMIAATTLGILFATSESLRKGIFRLDEYLNRLQDARNELAEAIQDKREVEQNLSQAQQRLDEVNRNFQSAQDELGKVSQEVEQLQQQLSALRQERQNLLAQRQKLENQIVEKDQELAVQQEKLQATEGILQETEDRLEDLEEQRNELRDEIKKQDNKIADLDTIISKRDQVLQFQEQQVKDLETEIGELQEQIQALEQYYQNYQALRQGNVALVKGEVLAFNVVKIKDADQTEEIIKKILRQANRNAIEATQPGNENFNEPVIFITKSQIKRLKDILDNGEQYVVQIVAAGNYLSGEKKIRVFADVIPNQKVFDRGEVIASLSLNPEEVEEGELSERIDLLLAASRFRARRSGVVGNIFVGNTPLELVKFMEELASLNQSYDQISAIAAQPAYTAGPLQLKLRVMANQQIILSN